jgi:predicted nucleic acid-binding protein
MAKSLLDTDMFSEILKGVDPVVAQRATAYRTAFGHYTISAITVLEIVKGLHSPPILSGVGNRLGAPTQWSLRLRFSTG